MKNLDRRKVLKLGVAGAVAVPFSGFVGQARAELPLVGEDEPLAMGLNYVHDATASDKRTDDTATCASCVLYPDGPDAAEGPCTIFPGKSVKGAGWCSSYAKRP